MPSNFMIEMNATEMIEKSSSEKLGEKLGNKLGNKLGENRIVILKLMGLTLSK